MCLSKKWKSFKPVFRHFPAGILKNLFQDIVAYTLESKSYFIEISVSSIILAVGFKKGEGTETALAP